MMNEKYQQTLDYMNKIINEDKLSHAFLIECRNVPMYMNLIFPFIKSILNKYKYDENLDIDALVNSENYPELKIIRPINNVIRKEQLLELQSEFSIKAIYGKYLIYVIDGAEYLNTSSANTMLKFLEEPNENIIAILLTNNCYNVIKTISSRCQTLIFPEYDTNENFSKEVIDLYNNIENNRQDALGFVDNVWYCYDKDSLIQKLKELQNYYIYKFEEKKIETNEEKLNNLSKKILLIDEYLKKLRYNVNIKMLMDKFLLEIGRQ